MIYLYFDTDAETYTIEQVLGVEYGVTFIFASREYPSLEKLINDINRWNFSWAIISRVTHDRYDTDLKRNKIKEYNYSNLKVFIEQEFPEYII